MWLKVTPEFPWLCRTHCSVCGIKEGAMLGIRIERLRFLQEPALVRVTPVITGGAVR